MRRFAFSVLPCLVIALMTGSFSTPAYADTYKVYDLGDANANVSFGLTDTGTAVVRGFCSSSNPASTYCYTTYVSGQETNYSDVLPNLVYDNGVGCMPAGSAGDNSYDAKCNGKYDAFYEDYSLKVGPVGLESILPSYSVGALQLNSIGDAFWVDASKEEIFEAIDQTTAAPEPSTLVLLGSGLLGVAGTLRRRILAS